MVSPEGALELVGDEGVGGRARVAIEGEGEGRMGLGREVAGDSG
jgi:hypothetical protein